MIFLGIKYEPLLDPPSLKFVSGAPGVDSKNYTFPPRRKPKAPRMEEEEGGGGWFLKPN